MNGFWGYFKGSLILLLKAMPRLLASPYIGAVCGAVSAMRKEQARCDAEIEAFQARYVKSLQHAEAKRQGNCAGNGVQG